MKVHKYVVQLTETERRTLKSLVRSGKTENRLADRARIILWADEGITIDESARRLAAIERRSFTDPVDFWNAVLKT